MGARLLGSLNDHRRHRGTGTYAATVREAGRHRSDGDAPRAGDVDLSLVPGLPFSPRSSNQAN